VAALNLIRERPRIQHGQIGVQLHEFRARLFDERVGGRGALRVQDHARAIRLKVRQIEVRVATARRSSRIDVRRDTDDRSPFAVATRRRLPIALAAPPQNFCASVL